MVPVFPSETQSIKHSTAKKRKLRSSLLDTSKGSPNRFMELTKTTRADSFLLGTSTSMTERKQFSSLKKNLILEDDH